MFVALGLRNAWRNRGRTALGIVSMAVASVIFLSSSTLSSGYPAAAFFSTRRLLGGDVLLLPGKSALSQQDLATGGYTWAFQRKAYDSPDLTMGLDTTPYSYGAVQGTPASGDSTVSAERYAEVLQALKADSSVKTASVRQSLPFIMAKQGPTQTVLNYGFLDARDVAADLTTWNLNEVTDGQYLSPYGAAMAGVACASWAGLQVTPGGLANLQIPRYSTPPGGGTAYLDYEDYLGVSLNITGQASFSEGAGKEFRVFSDPVIFVSQSTLTSLAKDAGYPEQATYWGISVTVADMSKLENVAALFRREFPDFTVVAVSTLESAAAQRTSISAGIPMDMRRITEGIAFVTAALLSATNLTVMMLSRKNEIGILRAIGATGLNIACMVLTESVWIALLGALAGTIITQPAILWQLMSNSVSSGQVLETVGAGVGRALAFAVTTAVVFGFLPVAKALRVTPAQVLRGD